MSRDAKLKKQKLKIKNPSQDSEFTKNKGSTDKENPIFSFHLIQKNYCITDCDQAEKASFAECLRKLSSFNWLELKNDKRHGLGCEKISSYAIKASIPANIPKNTAFLAFRFHGKASMVGYREQAIFHVLWLDRGFTLYRHS